MASEPRPEPAEAASPESAPEPSAVDGDAKEPTSEVVADAFVDDVVVEKQNAALDALVARDREVAAQAAAEEAEAIEATPLAEPEKPATKLQEWAAAIVLMALVAGVLFALMSFLR